LRGCISDALLVKNLLTDTLGVPEEHIRCLLGPETPTQGDLESTPSRANIVDMLYSLVDNRNIEQGDSIFIYYAGHGSSYYCAGYFDKSLCDNTSCPTEALCPIDCDTQDSGGKWIPDISDRELNTLFTLICRAKGHNITFMTDC
ncbi:hypothetical protein IW262DRAFT_1249986, partial [Armillaria fumosa]